MSDLSRDARNLIAQAKKDGPVLLGPSARDRARVRAKLTPLWAANVPARSARQGWTLRLISTLVIAGLAVLGWTLRSTDTERPPLAAAAPELRSPTVPPPSFPAADPPLAAASAQAPSPRDDVSRVRPSLQTKHQLSMKRTHAPSALQTKLSTPPTADTAEQAAERSPSNRATASERVEDHDARDSNAQLATTASAARSGVTLDSAAAPATRSGTEKLPLTAAAKPAHSSATSGDMQPSPPSIDGELELLSAAQSALQQQRPSRALKLLQEHAFRFPTGALSQERIALQALALCASGRKHAAQTVLSNLETRAASSQLLPRVRSQCGL